MSDERLLVCKDQTSVVTVLGYPSKPTAMGGLLWLKRVVDHIEENSTFRIFKISNERGIINIIDNERRIINIILSLIDNTRDALKAFFTYPDVIILDTYGESNLILWILVRCFRPKVQILSVFHHYEPTNPLKIKEDCNITSRLSGLFQLYYNHLIESAFKRMMKDSDKIATVSKSSMDQLNSVCGLTKQQIKNKVIIVGASIDPFLINYVNNNNKNKKDKHINFLCVGRVDKFEGIERIWQHIRQKKSDAVLVMIGKADCKQIEKFRNMGIEHRGIVSDKEKCELYLQSEVFLFPSVREGYGMAVAESLYSGLPVIAWKLPVFEELYLNNGFSCKRISLVEQNNHEQFAAEAVSMLTSVDENALNKQGEITKTSTESTRNSWADIANRMMTILEEMIVHNRKDTFARPTL
jgi:glycosyltransferase involved in cell wall biosynthesis